MIVALLCDRGRDTLESHLETWGRSLRTRLRVVTYESLSRRRRLRGGTFIFADLERLTPVECARAAELAQCVERAGGRVVNRPGKTLRRFDLLRALHVAGRNPYNVHRTDDPTAAAVRFPAFVRMEREHNGPQTDLLHDAASLRAAVDALVARGARHEDLMIAEYLDTRSPADGLFRKYSAMRVGPHFVPRHVLFSEDWVDKVADVVNDATLAEEQAFLDAFPHRDQVEQVFRLTHVDYGRIDYAVVDGRVVTWEINTNPTVIPLPEKCDPRRLGNQSRSAKQVNAALDALNDAADVEVDLRDLPPVIASNGRAWRHRLVRLATDLCTTAARTRTGGTILHALRRVIDGGLEAERERRW